MSVWVAFFLGLVLGTCTGVFLVSLLAAGSRGRYGENHEQ